MPVAVIPFFCLLSALAGYVLKKRGVRTAYIWMMLVFISLILWFFLLLIPYDRFSPIIINDWFKFGETSVSLRFALNPQNWILVFSLIAFNLTFFLTGIARLNVKNDLRRWIFLLLLIAFSYLAFISADFWSVVLLWTILDLIELGFYRIIIGTVEGKNYFRKYIIKSLGSILLIWNIASMSSSGFNPLINGIVSLNTTSTIFLAAILHSGIFPLITEFKLPEDDNSNEILKSVFSVLTFAVSFSVITTLPAPELPLVISFTFSLLAYLLIIFASILWITKKGLNNSLQFLLLNEAGIFIFLYFSGAAQYITYLLALLVISVLWLILFTHRARNLLVFPVISTFFATGLPLSIITFGSRGFIGNGISMGLIIMLISQTLFIFGYLKFVFEKNEKFHELEIWYQTSYLAGLFFPFMSAAAIIFYSRTTFSSEIQYWLLGAIVTIIGLLGYLISRKKLTNKNTEKYLSQSRYAVILRFLSFEWLFKIFSFLEGKTRSFVNGFSGLMEGEGGIMWALVFLILILTMLT